MKTHATIIRTITTEKSSRNQEKKLYTFEVGKSATKTDVKKAIKEMYGAEAGKVKIMIMPRKTRAMAKGRIWTKRPVMKKAIVSLKGKKTIDPNKIK